MLSDNSKFFNEGYACISWIRRILEEADNPKVPLLERTRFLEISSDVLAELVSQKNSLITSLDGEIQSLVDTQQSLWTTLVAECRSVGILFEKEALQIDLHPVVDFDCIPDEKVFVAVQLKDRNLLFALPDQQIYRLPNGHNNEIRLFVAEEIVPQLLQKAFPHEEIKEYLLFSFLRKKESITAIETASFQKALQERKCDKIFMIFLSSRASYRLTEWILKTLNSRKALLVHVPHQVKIPDIRQLIFHEKKDLVAPLIPTTKHAAKEIFSLLQSRDLLLYYPYDSFETVVNLLEVAAEDPQVDAIEISIYRTDVEIIKRLINAAKKGKKVRALIERRAIGEEEKNLHYGELLEQAGATVFYGFEESVTHAKVLKIIRREGKRLVSYNHFSTGNFHTRTTAVYSDLAMFTTQSDTITEIKPTLLALIEQEIAYVKEGKPGNIWIKVITFTDLDLIKACYRASQAGVKIELIVRGPCLLRPGVSGLSENIRVKSILGRFLEHARIICFGNGHELPSSHAKVFLSSANWTELALDRRKETLVEIKDPIARGTVLYNILVPNLLDNEQSWILQPDGSYQRSKPFPRPFNCQKFFSGS